MCCLTIILKAKFTLPKDLKCFNFDLKAFFELIFALKFFTPELLKLPCKLLELLLNDHICCKNRILNFGDSRKLVLQRPDWRINSKLRKLDISLLPAQCKGTHFETEWIWGESELCSNWCTHRHLVDNLTTNLWPVLQDWVTFCWLGYFLPIGLLFADWATFCQLGYFLLIGLLFPHRDSFC